MTTSSKDPVLVVIQLSGANDYMNTVIPYSDPLYYDFRPAIAIPQEEVMPIDDLSWLPPWMAANKDKWLWLPESLREGRAISDWRVDAVV